MFRPVGSLPPNVYWRRRFVMLGGVVALIILLAVTVSVMLSDGSSPSSAADTRPPVGSHAAAPPATTSHSARPARPSRSAHAARNSSSAPHGHPPASGATSSGPVGSTSSAAPQPCNPAHLDLSAATDKARYGIHDNPTLSLLVTNPGPQACVQDLADPQIVLSVYNGEARVWGSHDCKIDPGTDERTLMPRNTVRVIIQWTGLSSSPNCAGTRQRVGAGSYTLYATLAGHQAKSTQFTIG